MLSHDLAKSLREMAAKIPLLSEDEQRRFKDAAGMIEKVENLASKMERVRLAMAASSIAIRGTIGLYQRRLTAILEGR